MKKVIIYTDGACLQNPGPGGWAAILRYGKKEKEICGYEINTTNNRMELTAVIKGLEALLEPCAVEIYSDSKYIVDAMEKGWAKSWKNRNWLKADKKPALNTDLWDKLLYLTDKHKVILHWVKGHAGHDENERCDLLATQQAKKASKYIKTGEKDEK